jgi:uncharacterized protein YndB with AHSA1/START domain
MTGPEGQKSRAWWTFTSVDAPRSLELDDWFADESGEPNEKMPVIRMRMDLDESGTGTRMTIVSRFATVEAMEQLLEMGMVEGMTAAMGQLDDVVAA